MLQIETVDSTNGTPAASRRARGLHLGARREHPAEADRRQDHRHRELLPEHLDSRIARR